MHAATSQPSPCARLFVKVRRQTGWQGHDKPDDILAAGDVGTCEGLPRRYPGTPD